MPAFSKLSENLIFVYGFKSYFATFDELKADCISFLFESIKKWDPSRGTKAFSYFNVVAKNWLIFNSNKMKKQKLRHISIENREGFSNSEYEDFVNSQVVPPPDYHIEAAEKKQRMMNVLYEINGLVWGCYSGDKNVSKNEAENPMTRL